MMILVILIVVNLYIVFKFWVFLDGGYIYVFVEIVVFVDVVIVLSGMLYVVVVVDGNFYYECNGFIDWFEVGFEYIQKGKVEMFIFICGFLFWFKGQLEGEVLKEMVFLWGIFLEKIVLIDIVQNMDQEVEVIV